MSSRVRTRFIFCLVAISFFAVSAFAQSHGARTGPTSPIARAKAQLARHDLTSAEASVWEVLTPNPSDAEALLLLGVIRDEQQRYDEAEAVLQKVVQLNPKSAAAHIYLGKTYLAENKLPDAIAQYKAAEELGPRDVETHVTLARLYAANGDFASALTSLNGIPAGRFPAQAVPLKIGCLVAVGKQEEAEHLAGTITDPAMALATAEVFVTSKMPAQALKLLTLAQRSGRRPPARFYFIKAKALDASGNSTEALANFQKALAIEPNSEEFLLGTAELYARDSKHDKAYEILQRAYKINQDSPTVLRPLILEASFAGKTGEVQEAAERLAKSDDPQDLFVAASVFLKTVRQDEAIPLLQKYLDKFPDDARAWTGLGLGYEDQKNFPEAQKAFQRALQADPKFAEAEYQLGVLISVSGDSKTAQQHYENAVRLEPRHVLALTKLGGLYLQNGQFEQAKDTLLRAESINPNDRQTEYGLALAYGKLGDREEARVHMERFQSKGPIGATEKK